MTDHSKGAINPINSVDVWDDICKILNIDRENRAIQSMTIRLAIGEWVQISIDELACKPQKGESHDT